MCSAWLDAVLDNYLQVLTFSQFWTAAPWPSPLTSRAEACGTSPPACADPTAAVSVCPRATSAAPVSRASVEPTATRVSHRGGAEWLALTYSRGPTVLNSIHHQVTTLQLKPLGIPALTLTIKFEVRVYHLKIILLSSQLMLRLCPLAKHSLLYMWML